MVGDKWRKSEANRSSNYPEGRTRLKVLVKGKIRCSLTTGELSAVLRDPKNRSKGQIIMFLQPSQPRRLEEPRCHA
jgi:hypothetical protein